MRYLVHPVTGAIEEAPVGIAWSMFVFGIFVSLRRQDLFLTVIMFVLLFLTNGFSWFIFPFFYNQLYFNRLKSRGYEEIGV